MSLRLNVNALQCDDCPDTLMRLSVGDRYGFKLVQEAERAGWTSFCIDRWRCPSCSAAHAAEMGEVEKGAEK